MNQYFPRILFVLLCVAAMGATVTVGRSIAGRTAQAWHPVAAFQGQGIAIEADPNGLKNVAAGSTTGAVVSHDGARTWEGPGIGGVPVFDLAFVARPGTKSARLIAGARSALFYSDDLGLSWDKFRKLPFLDYRAITANPSNPKEIWLGAWTGGFPGPSVFRTDDGGATWFAIEGGPSGSDVGSISVSANRRARGKANTFVYVGTYRKGMWATNDGGRTWVQLTRGMKGTESIMAAELTSADGGSLVAGSAAGKIYYSRNRGLNWTAARLPAGLASKAVELRSFAWDKLRPRTVYAIVGGGASRFLVSHDRGKSWSPGPQTGLTAGPLRALSIDVKERRLFVTGDLGSSLLTLPDP